MANRNAALLALAESTPDLVPAAPSGRVPDWRAPFRRLDTLMAAAVTNARLRFGAEASRDSFRGLYVSDEQAAAELGRPPGEPLAAHPDTATPPALEPSWTEVTAVHRGWRWLRAQGLSDTELDIILIALAPEADLRYERLYGYLQDDVTRRRPSVDLVLDLVSESAEQKVTGRALFGVNAPLLARKLVHLVADERSPKPSLLAHLVVLDEQVTDLLLVRAGLDRQLARYARLSIPQQGGWARTPLPPGVRRSVLAAARAAIGHRPLRVHLRGPAGSGRAGAAEALAGELGLGVLTLVTAHLPSADAEAAAVIARAFREAALHDLVLCVDGITGVLGVDGGNPLAPGSRAEAALLQGLGEHQGITALVDLQPWTTLGPTPLGVLEVVFASPELGTRAAAWSRSLQQARLPAPADLVQTLADRFSFGPARIAEAVASAVTAAGVARGPSAGEVFAAARRQTSHRLAGLARRIEPACSWADLVLPEDTTTQLLELCARVRLRSTVLVQWGFGRTLVRGRGTSALFTGPPGTGKTTAAEVVAGELGLDLFSIDLSGVVSKYIGETEKNLEQIFSAAAEADAILMFDEADALFGKRSEVHDAHDRYANIETSYLLQRMEQYEGIAILATNLRQNLDEAFTRRLQFIVDFPFPDTEQREGIWQVAFPAGAPLGQDLDLSGLAREFRLSGASIKNAALHAGFLAAAKGRPIDLPTVHQAVGREFRKMGQVPPSLASAAGS